MMVLCCYFDRQSGLKSQSFIEMIKSAKGSTQDEDLDDEEEYSLKKENSSNVLKGKSHTIHKQNNLLYFLMNTYNLPDSF